MGAERVPDTMRNDYWLEGENLCYPRWTLKGMIAAVFGRRASARWLGDGQLAATLRQGMVLYKPGVAANLAALS